VSQQNILSYDSNAPMPWLINDEKAYSVDLWANLWGRDIYVEAARMDQHANRETVPSARGIETGENPSAIMAMVDIWKTSSFELTGFYSDADAEYDVYYSAINPYYEVLDSRAPAGAYIPWERWLRRPLVMPNLEVIGGQLMIKLGSVPFQIAYYSLESNSSYWDPVNHDPNNRSANGTAAMRNPYYLNGLFYDELYSVAATKSINDTVDLVLTYAHQSAASAVYDDLDLIQAGVQVPF